MPLKKLWREIRPDALWDFIKWGIALLSVLILHLLQRWRGIPRDVVVDIGMFITSLLLISIPSIFLWRRNKKQSIAAPPALPKIESSEPFGCQDTWLHEIADTHKQQIDNYVIVEWATFNANYISDDIPHIDFIFRVFNGSVYTVSIEDSVKGYITFSKSQLPGGLEIVHNKIKKFPHGERGNFTVRLWISKEAAEVVKKGAAEEKGIFYIDHLQIQVSGEGIVTRQLKLLEGIHISGRPINM